MKYLKLYLLFNLLLISFVFYAKERYFLGHVYTYPLNGPSGTRITIDNTTFGIALTDDDVVIVDVNPNGIGWRSMQLSGLSVSDPANHPITIRFINGAYMYHNTGGQFQEGSLNNCIGVRIVNVNMHDNSDVLLRVANSTYSSYITIDSSSFQNMPGVIFIASTLPNFAGNANNMFHHLRFTNSRFDTTQNGNSGCFIALGSVAMNGFLRDVRIDHDSFTMHYSVGGVPSNFIQLQNCYNCEIDHNYFAQLGVVASPTGHACAVNLECGYFIVHDNTYYQNWGNAIRLLGIAGMPMLGAVYNGFTSIYGEIEKDKRKYPFLEMRDVPADITTLSPYVIARTGPRWDNNTEYNPTATLYTMSMFDWYGGDSMRGHNNVLVMRTDGWADAYGPTITSYSVAGAPAYIDTANNVLSQLWINSGISDSTTFTPLLNGRLYHRGTTLSYFSTDHNGAIRIPPWDIGAVAYPVQVGCNCITSKVKLVTHP